MSETIQILIFLGVGLLIFLFVMFIIILLARENFRCPKCNKIGLEQIDKEEISRDMSTKSVKKEIKDEKGQVVGTIDVDEPVTVITYLVTYRCKNCGEIVKKTKTTQL